jgi:diketogulonate reductase-like aldo/keto reductase
MSMRRLGHVADAVIQRSPTAANTLSRGKLDLNTTVELRDGGKIPIFGLGTWRAESGGECREACDAALATGYQLLDTASGYDNEEDVGAAIAESGRSREEIYVVTKHSSAHGYAETLAACDA